MQRLEVICMSDQTFREAIEYAIVVVSVISMVLMTFALIALSLTRGGIMMYLDVTYIKETRIAVKLAKDEKGMYYIIVRNLTDTDINPAGYDDDQAWAYYQQTIENYKQQNYIF